MSNNYTLNFDLLSYKALDKFALLANQKYNLGDRDDWFNCFRGGLHGLFARVMGVKIHYHKVHSWKPVEIDYMEVEYHVSTILFNMDSALECMVFALNALGYIVDSDKFLDVTNEKELRKIAPYNILVLKESKKFQGYDDYFPSLKSYWHENRDLICTISEQHNVSKHRKTIFKGGKVREDPPQGFFEKMGMEDDKEKQILFSPMAEIILTPQPKTPLQQGKPPDYKNIKLEDIAKRFCTFINICGVKALEDAKSRVKLSYSEFRK